MERPPKLTVRQKLLLVNAILQIAISFLESYFDTDLSLLAGGIEIVIRWIKFMYRHKNL